MPYNLKHRETGEFMYDSRQNRLEFADLREAAKHFSDPEAQEHVFRWEAVEVVKPLPTETGLYVHSEDTEDLPINIYARNPAGQWYNIGPDGWERRESDSIPRDLVRLVPENS